MQGHCVMQKKKTKKRVGGRYDKKEEATTMRLPGTKERKQEN